MLAEVAAWQPRPLDRVSPVLLLDALRVRIRGEDGVVRNKAVYLALGITAGGTPGGRRTCSGCGSTRARATFWHRVLSELKTRGVEDVCIALVDGLTGFPEAIGAVFPRTQVHTCVVHLVRRSLAFVSYQDRKRVAAALRRVYRAETVAGAEAALADFARSPEGRRYPTVVPIWERAWEYVTPAFHYPPEVRRLLTTTNALEALNRQIRQAVTTRGHFPSDEAAVKLLSLALRNARARWGAPPTWRATLVHFAVLFGDRFTPEL